MAPGTGPTATEPSASSTPQPPTRGGRLRGRPRRAVLAFAAAVLLLLAGLGLGGAAAAQADSGGYFSSSEHRFATSAAALKTDEIEVGSSAAHAADPNPDVGEVARVRVVVRAADPDVPMFVGIGPKEDVERYLRGTAHDDFRSARLSPFKADFARVGGGSRATAPPTAEDFWAAASYGPGTRTLTWDKTHGAWSAVVMRLDGAPGVDVRASSGCGSASCCPRAWVRSRAPHCCWRTR
ncbi:MULTISPECIES: hypothetical protein [Actinomadura]|uniref:Uncharacterized protein n=2 Tax=Actinomadura yumaensis TaxID=111807 RepID=A0ABW2CW02_9ACTN|nr:hypothetical protein [Actinomadura sp. J1-007]MWK38603.1 hypothetical protein [Actinomadura sp. J1-007]